jgi:hypothetical protein
MIDPSPFSLSLLVLLKDFLPASPMYAPLFFLFSLSTAVAIAVVRSSNNHKKKRKGRVPALILSFTENDVTESHTRTHIHGIDDRCQYSIDMCV